MKNCILFVCTALLLGPATLASGQAPQVTLPSELAVSPAETPQPVPPAEALVKPASITAMSPVQSALKATSCSLVEPKQNKTTEADAKEATVTIPAGTTVLLSLRSGLSTVSARDGSGVYLEVLFPVIQDGRIVLPTHTQVQGTVTTAERPGRVKGKGGLHFHFTEIILPDHRIVPIAGSLESLPGSRLYATGSEGRVHPVDQIDKDAVKIAGPTAGGLAAGSIARGVIGGGRGAAIGAGFGLARVLFGRGDDVHLPEGTRVEMVLDRPLTIPSKQ
jgi:hypothetical protein